MIRKELYLREDVYVEPLFNGWYAWPYLVPPVTAARYLVKTHQRVMRSFVNNAELHVYGSKEKGMAGAEFVDCAADQVADVEAILKTIEKSCTDLIELCDAVQELETLLRDHTSGETIQSLYAAVPAPLQGCVELFMDMEHRPSYRLIEPLLYRSKYYRTDLQSISFGLHARVAQRPFVLSTPRLPDRNHLQIGAPFCDSRLDDLFRSREEPIAAEEMAGLFDSWPRKGGLACQDLYTTRPPVARHVKQGDGIKLTYIGHAGFLIESPEASILIDPVLPYRGDGYAREVVSFSELPSRIDIVCLTHNHLDHSNLETLLQLRYKIGKVLVPKNNGGTLSDPSMRLIMKQLGFNAVEVDELDEVGIPNGRIVSIPFLGEHGDLNIRSKTAWYVEICGRRFFFGADSSNLDPALYAKLATLCGDVDVLAIGMECTGAPYTWAYGALHTRPVSASIRSSRRLNGSDCQQALEIVRAFNPRQVYVYALGREPWYRYFMGIEYSDESRQMIESAKLMEHCRDMGIPAASLYAKEVAVFDPALG